MKILDPTVRYFMGGIFLLFGVNKFLSFIPIPGIPVEAAEFLVALNRTGYFFFLLGVVEILAALLLFSGQMAPLGIAMLAAVIPHIALYLTMLARTPQGYVMASLLLSMEAFLIFRYAPRFVRVFRTGREENQI